MEKETERTVLQENEELAGKASGGLESVPAVVVALTEEEQMALYEASLKESDWGHQPC